MTQIVRKRPRSGCTKRTFFTAAGQKDRARRSPPSAFGARRWSRRSSRRKRGSVRRDAGAVLNVETCGKRSIGMEGDAEDQLLERRLVNWGRWARDTNTKYGTSPMYRIIEEGMTKDEAEQRNAGHSATLIRRAVKPSPSGGGYKAPLALRESKIKNHEDSLRLQV